LTEATPLEVVARSGLTRETIQPRLSELIALRLIEPTGARRRNPSGRSAAVLRLTAAGRAAL
jgi:DNA-binding MarR family transcriptional regulator